MSFNFIKRPPSPRLLKHHDDDPFFLSNAASPDKPSIKARKILINVKVPAHVKNADKAIALMGGKQELINVFTNILSFLIGGVAFR